MEQKEEREYLTTDECAKICRYKDAYPIRRAIKRGELPAIRIYPKRLLIPARDFWVWFKAKTVKPIEIKPVELKPEIVFVPSSGRKKAHFKFNPEAVAS